MPALIVIAGPNGAGKSTLTQFESADGRARLIDPDAIARRINPTDPSKSAAAAGREALLRRQEYLNGRISFAIETTLTGKSVVGFMREAKASGYRVQLLFIAMSNPELHIRRVRLRVSQGGHAVPDEDIRRRYTRSLENLPEALRIADVAAVFDNSGTQRQLALEVQDGRIIWRAERLPGWVQCVEREFLR